MFNDNIDIQKKKLGFLIEKKQITRATFARYVGISEASLCRYIRGDRIPSVDIAIKIADLLGVDVKDVW